MFQTRGKLPRGDTPRRGVSPHPHDDQRATTVADGIVSSELGRAENGSAWADSTLSSRQRIAARTASAQWEEVSTRLREVSLRACPTRAERALEGERSASRTTCGARTAAVPAARKEGRNGALVSFEARAACRRASGNDTSCRWLELLRARLIPARLAHRDRFESSDDDA